jgi:acyl carrier protein
MTDQPEITRRIRSVLVRSLSLGLSEEDLSWSDRLDEATALDSMAALEFALALEKEFGITIEPEHLEVALLRDLPRLRDYISRRLA